MKDINERIRAMFTIGTPLCGLSFAALAIAFIALIIGIGIPKTLLVVLFAFLGWFIGGVKDKKKWIQNLINRLFPPRDIEIGKPDEWKSKHIVRRQNETEQTGTSHQNEKD